MRRTGTPTTEPYQKPIFGNGRAPTANTFATATCSAHHGEFLQGIFEKSGRLSRGLVTVPFENSYSEAHFRIDHSSSLLTVSPPNCVKALRGAELAMKECGQKGRGGQLVIDSKIPIRLGMGSSTADVVAAIKAVARKCGAILPAEVIAELAVAAETASDSTMFGNRAVLLAHREGAVIEYFSGPLPHLLILGFNTDLAAEGVDTLAFPPAEYSVKEVMEFAVLRALVRRAIDTQSAALIGRVASASARINQSHLPKPHFDRLERIAEDVGALGLQVAHSGTIAGFIFEPGDPRRFDRLALARARINELGITEAWDFEVSDRRREVAA